MRIRTIKPEFWTSLTITQLSYFQRLVFIGLWNQADDEGRGLFDPRLLKAALFPLDDDATVDNVEEALVACSDLGLIHIWADANRMYYAVVGWKEHQSISKPRPSKFPEPSGNPPVVLLAGKERNRERNREQGKEIPAAPVKNELAEVLLASDSRARYFAQRLVERDAKRWGQVRWESVLMKLGQEFDARIVIEAMGYIYEQPDTAEEPFPYLRAICRRIDERGAA